MSHPTLDQDPTQPSADLSLQWPSDRPYATSDRAHQPIAEIAVWPYRSEPMSTGAYAGYIASSSSSSLAMALDERAIQRPTPSTPTGPAVSSPEACVSPSHEAPAVYYASGSTDGFQSVVPSSIEGYSTSAYEAMLGSYGFGMYFPESAYEAQYPTQSGNEMPVSYAEDGNIATPHYDEAVGYADSPVIDTGVAGQYTLNSPFSPLSAQSYGYDYDSPLQEEQPVMMPSPPTAAQISRSSTLADAIKLPPSLQARSTPPPVTPQPLASTSMQVVAEPTSAADPQQTATSPSSPAAPSSSNPTSVKRRPTKSGRPRGRPPKHPLTFLPRHKFGQQADGDTKPIIPSGVNYPAGDAQTHSMLELPVEGGVPGQSSFMLDNAIPEPPKKKPIMACLFCRERKIACGPPPAEQEDQTCKQCLRRDLICEWPTESKRGQHKRLPRKKAADDNAEEGMESTMSSSSKKPSKGKSKAKPKPKLTPEELEQRKIATDVQAVTDRQSALKRQRKLAAAQRKRLLEMKMLPPTVP